MNSQWADETIPSSWKTFQSNIGRFSIDYPSNWSSEHFTRGYHNDQEAVALFTSASPFPGVIIAQKEMASPTLDDVARWGEERILATNNDYDDEYELFDLQDDEMNGVQVTTREYLMDLETALPLKRKDIYVARDYDGIIITFITTAESYDNVIAIFDHMSASFRSQ